MRIILISVFAFGTLQAWAQNKINSYQYWFDGLYNNAVSQSITPIATYQLTTQINTSTLLHGLHVLNITFKDDSARFSNTLSTFFYKPLPANGTSTIALYQYWFDDNFTNAITQSATANTDFTFAENINAFNLINGLHVLHIRFKDNLGIWSETLSQFFYKSKAQSYTSNNITAYQYWFDQNFAGAVQQTINANALFTLATPINANNLLSGLHVLNVRFLDESSTWSNTTSQFFYKAETDVNNNITKFQYWFDQNFAGAMLQNITPTSLYELNNQVATNTLQYGLHAISTRFMDVKGKWSSTTSTFFYKDKPADAENKMTAYRYWFDDRDSILNLVAIAPIMNPLILNQQIAADGMDSGQHVIHFQFQDIHGKWSMVTTDTATVIAKATYTFNGNGNWSDANNWVNKIKPPLYVTGTYKIFIAPIANGQCVLDVSQQITNGAIFTIRSGKTLVIPGNLDITP